MSLETAKAWLRKFGKEQEIIQLSATTATVDTAASALGVSGNEIAKSVSLYNKEGGALLIVTAGHRKIDSKKFRDHFGFKANMLAYDDVEKMVGHPVGGVCPFGVKEQVAIYLDHSLKDYEYVYPACGSLHTSIRLSVDELEQIVAHQGWVDVTRPPL
ncbi:YbaK/EbsC family protein [Niabella beijingensis]|uniref:YbaK/EbsC family protein n=1 Tax=Niabella beijingensis TaxID=2872700 RepID=UPI001CC01063|nr:YbaK/EbsC family protein [Niabella beijingensis]MBZ4190380.1 YbaK/EbsC family protein [Niabella beijingensis]